MPIKPNVGNRFFEGGEGSIQQVIPLGTGAVSTQTKIVGAVPKNFVLESVAFYGQAGVTATTLTAQVYARTRAGAAGKTVQSAAADIDFASAALAKTGVAAGLTTTLADQRLDNWQLLEVVITANTCSAGPGDLLVDITFKPRV